MRILHLTLKKRWFDQIASGDKKEEYREFKPYWVKRLLEVNYPEEEKNGNKTIYENIIFDVKVNNLQWEAVIKAYNSKVIPFDIIRFKNGYAKDSPEMDIEFKGVIIGGGNPNWGGGIFELLIIKLGEILSIKNYNQ